MNYNGSLRVNSKREVKGRRLRTAAVNPIMTSKLSRSDHLVNEHFIGKKHLRPFPTKADAHARVAKEGLMCVNPTIPNHCHTDESFERPDMCWTHTENNSHSNHDPQR
jgi:hypothetical protein